MSYGGWRFTLALAAGLMVASPSFARPDSDRDRAAARSAADAGADAFDQAQYERAIELFERAEQLVHAPTHVLFIARSLAKLGRLVEAHEAYMKILNEQLAADAPKAFKSARSQAEDEVGSVEARLAHVTVTVRGQGATTAALHIDQADVPSAEQGIPIPMDPGVHVFSAHAGELQSDERTLTLREGGKVSVELTLHDPAASVAETPTGSTSAETTATEPHADRSGTKHGISTRRVVAYTSLGIGAAGVGVGTYFLVSWAHFRGRATDKAAACYEADSCSDSDPIAKSAQSDLDKANRNATWAIVSYAVAAAGLGTGIVLLVTEPHAATSHARIPIRNLRIAAGFGSVTAFGEF